jgi:hypothetical protein
MRREKNIWRKVLSLLGLCCMGHTKVQHLTTRDIHVLTVHTYVLIYSEKIYWFIRKRCCSWVLGLMFSAS